MKSAQILSKIEESTRTLVEDHRRLSHLCTSLTTERDELQRSNRDLQEQLSHLKREVAKLQLSRGIESVSRSDQRARAQVNNLIREVDRCIKLLGGK